jgi:hypothetical protein
MSMQASAAEYIFINLAAPKRQLDNWTIVALSAV